jgi:hypothetical protein
MQRFLRLGVFRNDLFSDLREELREQLAESSCCRGSLQVRLRVRGAGESVPLQPT